MASARFTADGLLDAAQCAELCFIQRSQRRAGYMTGLSTVTFRELLSEPTLLVPLVAARSKVLEAVEEATGEILYVEYTGLNCWDSDAIIEPHYDSNRPYLEMRHYSALVYLSNQGECFTGGSFVFAERKDGAPRKVHPHAGRLLAFASGAENIHWVERVGRGERMVLTLWFSRDQSHSEDALVRAVGPRMLRPSLSARDKAVVAATLQLHGLRIRGGVLHDAPETAVSVTASCAAGGSRATRFESLNQLLQLCAFAYWRHGVALGPVLAGTAARGEARSGAADEAVVCLTELWREWHAYVSTLGRTYAKWLPEWWSHGGFVDCGGHVCHTVAEGREGYLAFSRACNL